MVFNAASSVLKEELKQEIVKKRHKNITFYCKKEHTEQPYSYHNLTDSLILFCMLNYKNKRNQKNGTKWKAIKERSLVP